MRQGCGVCLAVICAVLLCVCSTRLPLLPAALVAVPPLAAVTIRRRRVKL
jgi:hypothetical protein